MSKMPTAMRFRPRERGAALLIVLAAFVVTITTCIAVARVAAGEKLRRRMEVWTRMAQDLAQEAEKPIARWLEKESGDVVLPASSRTPVVSVTRDVLEGGGIQAELTITAWDQSGMLPLRVLSAGRSPWRRELPEAVRRTVEALDIPERTALGIDLLPPADGKSPFPVPGSDAETFSAGAYVATHNEDFFLNVNTAPLPLIEMSLRLLGQGGLEQIIQARSEGTFFVESVVRGGKSTGDEPRLVSVSNAWAFRIDVRVEGVRRSWWVVYRRESAASSWRCVQRLAITT